MRGWLAVAISLLLTLPAPALANEAGANALLPVTVVLGGLPAATTLAIREAEDHLLTDVSQRRLDDLLSYVEGFQELPAASGGLRDPAVRDAYAWTQQVVQVFVAIPARFAAVETAGAACRSEGASLTLAQARLYVSSGYQGAAELAALQGEGDRLLATAPLGIDVVPLQEALDAMRAWRTSEAVAVTDCLAVLALRLAIAAPELLDVVLLPARIYPGGVVRVVGQATGTAPVALSAPDLGWQISALLTQGRFSASFVVPRDAAFGNHTVTATTGTRHAEAILDVERAAVHMRLQAPTRVAANATFTIHVTVTSAAGSKEVDLTPVSLTWLSAPRSVTLRNGAGAAQLRAASSGTHVLNVAYPQSHILDGAQATLEITVAQAGLAPSAPESGAAPPVTPRLQIRAGPYTFDATLLVLSLVAAAALVAGAIVLRRALKRPAEAVPAVPPTPGLEAGTFAAGVAALFAVLRDRMHVPPGRTVREWVKASRAPLAIADRFDEVRYGDREESETLRSGGLDWLGRMIRRWRS